VDTGASLVAHAEATSIADADASSMADVDAFFTVGGIVGRGACRGGISLLCIACLDTFEPDAMADGCADTFSAGPVVATAVRLCTCSPI
jgi:hypothetical protein